MNTEERATRALQLSEHFQVAFVAAAVEHAIREIMHRLEERGFDEVANGALEKIWKTIREAGVDTDSLQTSEDECFQWAPDTEEEPDSGDLTFGLIAVAHACRVARRINTEKSVRGAINNCELAIAQHSYRIRPDSRSLGELAQADPLEWTHYPEVLKEARYQTVLLNTLEAMKMVKYVDRETLLKL